MSNPKLQLFKNSSPLLRHFIVFYFYLDSWEVSCQLNILWKQTYLSSLLLLNKSPSLIFSHFSVTCLSEFVFVLLGGSWHFLKLWLEVFHNACKVSATISLKIASTNPRYSIWMWLNLEGGPLKKTLRENEISKWRFCLIGAPRKFPRQLLCIGKNEAGT